MQSPGALSSGAQNRVLTGGRCTEWDTDPMPPSTRIWEEKGHQGPMGEAPRDPSGAQRPPRMDGFSLRAVSLADTQRWFSLLGLTTRWELLSKI